MMMLNNKCQLEDFDESIGVLEIVREEAKRLEAGDTSIQNFSFMLNLLLQYFLRELEALKTKTESDEKENLRLVHTEEQA